MTTLTPPRARFARLLLLAPLLAGCPPEKRVEKPASDPNPPKLSWLVKNNDTQQVQTVAGSGVVDAGYGHRYTVTLIASNAGGVHEVTVSPSTEWRCGSGDVGRASGPSLGTADRRTFDVGGDNKVPTWAELPRDVVVGPFRCEKGWRLLGGAVTLTATSANFFGGASQAALTLKLARVPLKGRIHLPVTATERPTVDAGRVCQLVSLELGQTRNCLVSPGGPGSIPGSEWVSVSSVTVGGTYDQQAHDCVYSVDVFAGDFEVNGSYAMMEGATPTWQPPPAQGLPDKITSSGRVKLRPGEPGTYDASLSRAITLPKGTLVTCPD